MQVSPYNGDITMIAIALQDNSAHVTRTIYLNATQGVHLSLAYKMFLQQKNINFFVRTNSRKWNSLFRANKITKIRISTVKFYNNLWNSLLFIIVLYNRLKLDLELKISSWKKQDSKLKSKFYSENKCNCTLMHGCIPCTMHPPKKEAWFTAE